MDDFEGLCEDLLKKFDKSGKPNVRKVYQADKTASKVAFIDYINEAFVPQSQRKAIPERQLVVEPFRWLEWVKENIIKHLLPDLY